MRRVLFLQGPSKLLNPLLDQGLIDSAYADDPEAARSEWGGLFRSDVTSYLPDDIIDRALSGDRSRPRMPEFEYCPFVDPSGGVPGGDFMTLAISHQGPGGRLVLDHLTGVEPPFQTEEVVARFCVTLSAYGCANVYGDKYAGLWPAQAFQRHVIGYIPSELDTSAIYREVAPLFMNGRASTFSITRALRPSCGCSSAHRRAVASPMPSRTPRGGTRTMTTSTRLRGRYDSRASWPGVEET